MKYLFQGTHNNSFGFWVLGGETPEGPFVTLDEAKEAMKSPTVVVEEEVAEEVAEIEETPTQEPEAPVAEVEEEKAPTPKTRTRGAKKQA